MKSNENEKEEEDTKGLNNIENNDILTLSNLTDSSIISDSTKGQKEETSEEKKEIPIGATRLLTQEDFERIEKLKKLQALQASAKSKKSQKRHREDGNAIIEQMKLALQGQAIDENNIKGYKKQSRMTKQDRWDKILAGREGRDKYGRPKQKGGGTTNKAKLRLKPFAQAKHSRKVSQKGTTSLQDKLTKRGEHLQNLHKHAKAEKKNKRKKT